MMRNKGKIQLLRPRLFARAGAGQSIVETAIILPVLLLMLLGVFEVGWALRGYLFLVNVNREATRFASRGVYLDFSNKVDPDQVGYSKVVSHSNLALDNNLGLNFTLGGASNGTMIITYYTIKPKTSFSCPGNPDCSTFDCTSFNPDHPSYVAGEDVVDIEYPILIPPQLYETDPNLPAYYNQVLSLTNTSAVTSYHYHIGAAHFSRINPEEQVVELRARNNQLNCQLRKKNLPLSDDNVIVIEHIYEQQQLSGLFSWVVPNPVPFYSHTAMRVSANIRQEEIEAEEVCSLAPIIIPNSIWPMPQGASVTLPVSGSPVVQGNFAFVEWRDIASPGTTELQENISTPENAATAYVEPDSSPEDTLLNVGDWVRANPGTYAGTGAEADLTAMIGQDLVMPVWFDLDCGGGPCLNADASGGGKFRVYSFVIMKLTAVDLAGAGLTFQYNTSNPSYCVGDDVP